MSIIVTDNDISSTGTLTLNNRSIAEVAYSGDYNDLSNKPTIGSDGMLIDQWYSDDKRYWLRKHDDGFIEQGGWCSSPSQTVTVTLNTAFTSAEYYANVVPVYGGNQANYNPEIQQKTTQTFFYNSMLAKSLEGYWYACGY